MAETAREPGGVLLLDKPVGLTSHDAVAVVRRALGTRRVGHTGTLDPFASGLLLLCVGAATRVAEYLVGLPKTYVATLRLGETTDTDDLTGAVVARSAAAGEVSGEALEVALRAQAGEIEQLPPVYSAKKVDGQRLYAVARRGGEVRRAPVRVTIHRIGLLEFTTPDATFEVECSSGTYVRAIARDVGAALGVGAHLRALRRTRVGRFAVEQAVALGALDAIPTAGSGAWLAPAAALAHLPRHTLSAEQARAVAHGRAVAAPQALPGGTPVVLLAPDGALLAIAEAEAGRLRPRKVLA